MFLLQCDTVLVLNILRSFCLIIFVIKQDAIAKEHYISIIVKSVVYTVH